VKALRSIISCVFVASLLGGCGSTARENGAGPDPRAALAAAPQKTLAEKSARFSQSEEDARHPPLPGDQARGVVSFASRETRLSLLSGDRYIYTTSSWYVSKQVNDLLVPGKKWLRFRRDEFGVDQDDRPRPIEPWPSTCSRNSSSAVPVTPFSGSTARAV
jgi:hypothetical protein